MTNRQVILAARPDHSGDGIAFLHGVHHHMVAFAKSNAPGLHHLSWDVGSVDEIGVWATHKLGKGRGRDWALEGVPSGRTISTMSAIPGAAIANIRPASLSPPTSTGKPTTRRRIHSTSGGPIRPRSSCTTTRSRGADRLAMIFHLGRLPTRPSF